MWPSSGISFLGFAVCPSGVAKIDIVERGPGYCGRGDLHSGGIERGERYHVPGSMFWIRPETFHAILLDIFEAIRRRGFRVIVVVCGHFPGIDPVRASGAEFLAAHPEMRGLFVTDQEVAPDLPYPAEHAAGGETSLLMAIRPDLVDLAKAFETDRSLAPYYAREPRHLRRRHETNYKYIGVFRGPGIVDTSNDPELTANAERGHVLLETIAERIATGASMLLTQPQQPPG